MGRKWTPEQRAQQAARISEWKPWESSTGPRSEAGKSRASRNADKGGEAGKQQRLDQALGDLDELLAKVKKLSGRRQAFSLQIVPAARGR